MNRQMKGNSVRWMVAGVVLSLIGLAPAGASGGRIPIAAPMIITQPGSYYVTQDISAGVLSGGVIQINCNNVSIDLAGHTVTQLNTDAGTFVIGSTATVSNISIINGQLVGGNRGISFVAPSGDFRFEHLTLSGFHAYGIRLENDPSVGFRGRLEALTVKGGAYDGMVISGCQGCVIQGCTVIGTGAIGLRLANSPGSQVIRNQILQPGTDGIFLLESNTVRLAENNVVNSINAFSISTSAAVSIEGNNIINAGHGIYADSFSHALRISGNSVAQCSSDGMLINASDSTVEWNLASQNDGFGIRIDGSRVVYRFNGTPGNTAGTIRPASDSINGGGNNP